ncbi:hypothetical protein HN014_07865 [Aquimarina sp. TRL1]|uniref:hypothetical protein n=1 Tax=Aquimarina sp. (strain TRL1) TaxID=2736252 RepID=UPI00158B77E8|nr:hypothetical protein [Aquimarina sp. TRL1]QKX04834.1 hypothetical protein HN014_07865 [Aquimarina sp. TRL1]
MKQKTIYYTTFLVFSLYWGATIFFNAPDNYMKIKLMEEESVFKTFFYQNWSFFAPPPNTNERLYCVIYDKQDSTVAKVLELVTPIIERKVQKAPFNSKDDIMDYVISSSTVSLNNKMVSLNETVSYLETKDTLTEKEKENILIEGVQATGHFNTLLKYSREIALEKGIDLNKYLISLEYAKVPIPKFVDRHKKELELKEELVFKSRLFDLSDPTLFKKRVFDPYSQHVQL